MGFAAVFVALALTSLIVTSRAAAHAGHDGHAVDAQMQQALEAAPDEVDGRCVRTITVPGLGAACATDDGLFRVRERNGDTFTTHGADGPTPAGAANYSAASTRAIQGAGPADIQCVSAASGAKHTKLVYSYPAGQVSRYSTVAPQLIQEAYRASAFLRAESRSVVATKGVKLLLECDASGTPVVHEVQLATSGTVDSFSTVVSDLKAKGLATSQALTAPDRLLVFHDSTVASGAAGTGHLYRDDRARVDNSSNRGGLVAVEFAWSGRPHWDVLLHELAHNMGAVQASAANATDSGHCNDGVDIMCYADGSADSAYVETSCSVALFDCGRDDYFNPAPAAGSYLAAHWNVASAMNRYLLQTVEEVATDTTTSETVPTSETEPTASTVPTTPAPPVESVNPNPSGTDPTGTPPTGTPPTVGDTQAPARPASVRIARVTATTVVLAWSAASDDVAVTGYRVERLDRATQRWVGIGAAAAATQRSIARLAPRTRYQFRVAALDAAGHRSPYIAITAVTARDTAAPAKVRARGVIARAKRSADLRWHATTDNVAVTRYLVYQQVGGAWKQVGSTSAQGRSFSHSGLSAGTHRYQLRARDAAGNIAPASVTIQLQL